MIAIPYEDRSEIIELTHRYSLYIDSKRIDELVELFTDDALVDETGIGLPAAQGREKLRTYFADGAAAVQSMIHYVTNHIFDHYDGTTARGLCFVLAEARDLKGGQIKVFGHYQDEYVKLSGRWRFRSRIVKAVVPPELGSYPVEH